MHAKELVSVVNLGFRSHTHWLLQNVSFVLQTGECLAILGANGSGKSTTLKLLAGLLRPSQGQILIQGRNIHQDPKQAKPNIGYLAEQLPLYGELTINEYLNLVCNIRKIPNGMQKTRIDDVCQRFNLNAFRQQLISQLSRGTKQRVAIAQAILHQPPVLLLDEPTAGLDSEQVAEFIEFLKEYKNNACIIFSSHANEEVDALADKVLKIQSSGITIYDTNPCMA